MKQHQFEAHNQALWDEVTAILKGGTRHHTGLPARYRRLCQCLALAQQRGYSPALTAYLQNMVTDCHRLIYGTHAARPNTLLRYLMVDFPCRVRAEWKLLLAACMAFFGVGALVGLLIWFKPDLVYSFISPGQLANYREMYQPGTANIGRGGDAEDFAMFGHYIWNNVSIGFRSFALGLAGMVPALLLMAYNGILLGVLGSALSQNPATLHTFWSFVITHASLEITGFVLAAMAGMKLGLALIRPGRMTRGQSLRHASELMFPVLLGASLMIFVAAFIEAFWSASPAIPQAVKYGVGGACWLLVIAYFSLAGRGRQ